MSKAKWIFPKAKDPKRRYGSETCWVNVGHCSPIIVREAKIPVLVLISDNPCGEFFLIFDDDGCSHCITVFDGDEIRFEGGKFIHYETGCP